MLTTHKQFSEELPIVLDRMTRVLLDKGHDYSGGKGDEDRFANFRICELAGITAWKGCVIRLTDKMSRILSFCKQEECHVKDESVEDTLIDMANYAIICLFLFREHHINRVDADNGKAADIARKLREGLKWPYDHDHSRVDPFVMPHDMIIGPGLMPAAMPPKVEPCEIYCGETHE